MKKFLSLFLIIGVGFILSACGEINENNQSITITFETNNNMTLHPLVYDIGETVELPQLESVNNHTFIGWYFDEALVERASNLENQTDNFTLYAKWEEATTDIIIDLFTEVVPTDISMNEIALFIKDDLGNLTIQRNDENPLAIEAMPWVESAVVSGFFDPDDDEDSAIYTWQYNAFIVRSDGSIYAWGDNQYGQLGTGNKESSGRFIDITSSFDFQEDEAIIKMVGNEKTTFALTSKGNVYAWGLNTFNMIGGRETVERLSPTNLNDEYCGTTEHFFYTNGFCGDTDSNINDIVVTESNVFILTNHHQVFAWGANINQWFTEIEITSEHISEAIYMYFEGHATHLVASLETVVLISDRQEMLILGETKLGTSTDHAWGGGPVKTHVPDHLDPDDDGDGILTVSEININANTLMLTRSDGTIWAWGDNETSLIASKKGYDYYTSSAQLEARFNPQTITLSSQEACALDDEGIIWCWGNNSTKALSPNNEMVLSTSYKYIDFLGENTFWDGSVEDETNLKSSTGPIRWMAPESSVPAPFAIPYRLVTVTRYHISAIPASISALEVTLPIILSNVCPIDTHDCDDTDYDVHPDAFTNYKESDGEISWTLEVRVERLEIG